MVTTQTNTNQSQGRNTVGININEMGYGVEIECGIPQRGLDATGWTIGDWRTGNPIPAGEDYGDGWALMHDGSLGSGRRGRRMCEVVSPIFRGPDGFKKIKAMIKQIKSMGGRVNQSCGLHVNISHPKLFKVGPIRRLIQVTAQSEPALFAIQGSTRRETVYDGGRSGISSNWCRGIKETYKRYGYDTLTDLARIQTSYSNRYHVLNLNNATHRTPENRRRVEFRVFSATLNHIKMFAYIRVAMGLVQFAIDSKTKPVWDLVKPSKDANLPDGVFHLRKLFHKVLNWYPNVVSTGTGGGSRNASHASSYRNPRGYMGDNAQRDLNQSARMLVKMAKQFDAAKGFNEYPPYTRNYVRF
jgi:hypothetical protein